MVIEFQKPWRPVADESEAHATQRRLDFEVTDRHPLYGQGARVIGRSDSSDDILVRLDDGRFAIVHLVFGPSPGDAVWPWTTFYPSAEMAMADVHG